MGNCNTGCNANEAKKNRVCSDAFKYVEREMQSKPKKAIISCEGGCVKGEIARVAANILAYRLERENAVRICLGDAATGNSGMLDLVKRAPEVIAIEGCPLQCGTEIMKYKVPDLETKIIDASSLYKYDRDKYFEILDMPREDVILHASHVANMVRAQYFGKTASADFNTSCCK